MCYFFFLAAIHAFKANWKQGGRRGNVGPSFLARGVGSTQIYPLREGGRQEKERSRISSQDAVGTPVKNSCSYVSAPSPWHQGGRAEGEMTENRGGETEETNRKGKRKIFP